LNHYFSNSFCGSLNAFKASFFHKKKKLLGHKTPSTLDEIEAFLEVEFEHVCEKRTDYYSLENANK